ncbi:hypothetical protein B0A69_21530 [Chryseobacterium shigense]|uniref:Uncharacterized protein n=1 Tax=Chryseobacterium shigense TaxID=297244 RepID=A0A1N7ISR7_9FLAO|nr:hypothetical protein [Chryseobacterium shigense]PQA89939.1 hypothetical protein B0A69_21530 [Chryseobacterium shigense]SIS40011.1 hypothetical protein SAMN05421639_104502 [Chryseobacterium shigense]
MNKILLIFLLVFLYNFKCQDINRARIRDSLATTEYDNKMKLSNELITNFNNLDYSKLNKKIIKDIEFKNLKSKNIIFYYSGYCNHFIADDFYTIHFCAYKTVCPAFNQTHFWTEKTIKYIVNKYNVNLIPYLGYVDSFITDDKPYETFEEKIKPYYYDNSKDIILKTKNESKGLFVEKYKNSNGSKIEDILPFYYFSNKGEKGELILRKIQGKAENYGCIFISFENIKDKIVIIRIKYNLDTSGEFKDTKYKVYQYKNKKWKAIPFRNEYKSIY